MQNELNNEKVKEAQLIQQVSSSETKNESLQQEIVELQKMLNDTGDENANQLLEIQGKLSALKINQKAHEKKKNGIGTCIGTVCSCTK